MNKNFISNDKQGQKLLKKMSQKYTKEKQHLI